MSAHLGNRPNKKSWVNIFKINKFDNFIEKKTELEIWDYYKHSGIQMKIRISEE